MMRMSSFLRAALVLLFCYMLAIGGTFNGLTEPQFRFVSLGLLAAVFGRWLYVHWRHGWTWHRTPLDAVFILWGVVFGLSLLANIEVWRRIAIGLWFVGLYVGIWYLLHDALANRGIRRDMLVDGLLFGGVVVLFFGYWQTYSWLLATDLSAGFSLPRPVSVLGNANTLAAFLVVLLPFVLGRLAAVRSRLARIALLLYTLATGGLLFLTFSRGGWIGAGAGLATWFGLLLAQHDLLSWRNLRGWWTRQQGVVRAAVLLGVGVVLLIGAGGGVILVRSLSVEGRDIGLRTYLYEAALNQFTERPLAGYGLFTFGRHLPRFASMPEETPHSHAHNVPLHIAAELGLVGLIALAVTLVVLAGVMRRNFRETRGHSRMVTASAIAAVVGFGVHHLLDTPAMMPTIALVGLVALVLATAPAEPVPLAARWRVMGHPLAMAGLPVLLLATGLWSSMVYSDYWQALVLAHDSEDYRGAASAMQAAIDREPEASLYRAQQAFLLGMAYSEGDFRAGREALEVYERVVAQEPYFAPYRANLAALLWQHERQQEGLDMLQTATDLAPESWQLQYGVGLYAEVLGLEDVARAAYEQALAANPDADLHPDWGQTALQAEITSAFEARMPLGQVAVLLEDGRADEALALWEAKLRGQNLTSHAVVRALIALEQGEREVAVDWLARAERAQTVDDREVWLQLGAARLARFDGSSQQTAVALERGVLDADWVAGVNVANAQFLRRGIARQFLPQVYYPTMSPVLAHLLTG